MVALLPAPELQFCDENGNPYVGGTLATYVPGTTTPKQTWLDPNQTAVQTNPIVLDAAGRCVVYGDGQYRLILSDAAGNLIYDQLSDTIVSAAMQPVMEAPTIADALNVLGVSALISNEATARANADSALQTQINNTNSSLGGSVSSETTRAEAAEATLQTNINNETARAEAAEAALHGGTSGAGAVRAGSLTTDNTGKFTVTFATPFANACVYFAVVDPHATLDSGTGLFTGFIKVQGFPGTSGPGSVSASGVSGTLIQQQMPTGGTNSFLAIITATTINYYAIGY